MDVDSNRIIKIIKDSSETDASQWSKLNIQIKGFRILSFGYKVGEFNRNRLGLLSLIKIAQKYTGIYQLDITSHRVDMLLTLVDKNK